MNFFNVLTMLGGLALFLYGMHIMGDGLAKMSGGKLEMILEKFTAKPITAVLLGAGVTAVIQSSSATTVMVVGFVNSGIMQLKQAVGIIMGANIGTTITSWILSLTGIEGENFVIQMLKPSSFAPILALIGVCLLLFTKSNKKKDIGSILAGFAILMIGMDTMSGAVKPLAEIDGFKNRCRCRCRAYSDHPEFFRIGWYPTGTLSDRFGIVCICIAYYHGTEYRNLCYGTDFRYWCNKECKKSSICSFLF